MSFANEASGTTTVVGNDIDTFKRNNLIQKADLPARVLLPMEEYGNTAAGIPEVMNVGTGNNGGAMIWNIIDLYLHKVAASDRSYGDVLPDLIRYAGNYAEVMLSNTQPTALMYLQTLTPIIGVYNFPVGSEAQFFGVECRLEFMENINPGG